MDRVLYEALGLKPFLPFSGRSPEKTSITPAGGLTAECSGFVRTFGFDDTSCQNLMFGQNLSVHCERCVVCKTWLPKD